MQMSAVRYFFILKKATYKLSKNKKSVFEVYATLPHSSFILKTQSSVYTDKYGLYSDL